MQNITVHYRVVDYNQQFAAIDQVCCKNCRSSTWQCTTTRQAR